MLLFTGDKYKEKDAEMGYRFVRDAVGPYPSLVMGVVEAVSRAYAYVSKTKYTLFLGNYADTTQSQTIWVAEEAPNLDGFIEIELISTFIKSHFADAKVRAFMNVEARRTVVILDPVSSPILLTIMSTLPMLSAWEGPPAVGEDARTLLDGCLRFAQGGNIDTLRLELQEIHKKLGLEKVVRDEFLNKLGKCMADGVKNARMNALADLEREIDTLEANLREYYAQIKEIQYELAGVDAAADAISVKEIAKFLDKNPEISILGDDKAISITSLAPLEFYDEDLVERMIDNESSALYYSMLSDKKDVWKKFLKAVFVDKTYKVMLTSEIKVPFEQTGRVHTEHVFSGEALENPHHERYSCLGANQLEIRKFANNGMYVPMMELCRVATQSINFAELPVVEFFMRKIHATEVPCIVTPDGRRITPKQAVKEIGG